MSIAASFPAVKGRCPACNAASLFLGEGGYVTCAMASCGDPAAAAGRLIDPGTPYYAVSGCVSANFIETEEAVIDLLASQLDEGDSLDDTRVCEVLVPQWGYAKNEDEIIGEARRRDAVKRAVDDRVDRVARALRAAQEGDDLWDSVLDAYREKYRRQARIALAAAEEADDAAS
jgi:hypothetical protein